jgi:hypothetical protein
LAQLAALLFLVAALLRVEADPEAAVPVAEAAGDPAEVRAADRAVAGPEAAVLVAEAAAGDPAEERAGDRAVAGPEAAVQVAEAGHQAGEPAVARVAAVQVLAQVEVGRVVAPVCGFLLGVFPAALARATPPVTVHREVRQREWCGFPPAALAAPHLRARHPRRGHPREVRALQAKPEVLAAHGSLPAALWFLPAASLAQPAASWFLPAASLAQPTVLWFLPAASLVRLAALLFLVVAVLQVAAGQEVAVPAVEVPVPAEELVVDRVVEDPEAEARAVEAKAAEKRCGRACGLLRPRLDLLLT